MYTARSQVRYLINNKDMPQLVHQKTENKVSGKDKVKVYKTRSQK